MAKRTEVFADRLRAMSDQADAAMQTYVPGGARVPDGIYIGKESAELREAQSSGKLMISRTFTIVEGEFTGLNVWDNLVIEDNDIGLQLARRWIELHTSQETGENYTWPEADLAGLETIINEIAEVGATVKLRVKTTLSKKGDGGEYTNATVQQILGVDDAVQSEAIPEQAPEQDAAAADDLESMDRNSLKTYIAGNVELASKIKVSIKMTDDAIREAIRAVIGEPAAAEEVSGVDINDILTFCASQGIAEVNDSMNEGKLVEVMSGYGFTAGELTETEVEMLTALGLENNIQKPIPAPKPAEAPKPAAPAQNRATAPKTTAAPASRPAAVGTPSVRGGAAKPARGPVPASQVKNTGAKKR